MPAVNEVVGRCRGNAIRAYWWTGERNFGDLITPALLRSYGLTPVCCRDPAAASLAATGSIIGMLPRDFEGIVLGSGLLSDNPNLRLPNARILALRGEMTKDRLEVRDEIALGDPGLLVADLLPRRTPSKSFVLGIVLHYEDRDNAIIRTMVRRYPREVTVINVQKGPIPVVRDIDRCQFVLSSSLHGVVAADALGIPNCWTVLSHRVFGKGFKFRDYYSAFGLDRKPIRVSADTPLSRIVGLMAPPPAALPVRQEALRSLFASVAREFHGKRRESHGEARHCD